MYGFWSTNIQSITRLCGGGHGPSRPLQNRTHTAPWGGDLVQPPLLSEWRYCLCLSLERVKFTHSSLPCNHFAHLKTHWLSQAPAYGHLLTTVSLPTFLWEVLFRGTLNHCQLFNLVGFSINTENQLEVF